jgi:hypothetical protein
MKIHSLPSQSRRGEFKMTSVYVNTVRDLVAGSGIRFEDWGPLEIAGQTVLWRLFRVER